MQEEDILKNDNAAEPVEQQKPHVNVPEKSDEKKGKLTDSNKKQRLPFCR